MSDFGAGVVVCLAKFSEHLHEHGPYSENVIREYARWDDDARERAEAEALRFPRGDAVQKLRRMAAMEVGAKYGGRDSAISRAIQMWMNGASDHFYDLDRDRAPAPLIELADLTLDIGHGFTGATWTIATVDRVRDLWRQSCLAVDRALGTEPDWGEW